MAKALFDDLADSYDQWYETPVGRAVDFVERKAIEEFFVPQGKSVLEIGCGTGLYTVWLASQDYEVTAVDVSTEMMEQAKEKVIAIGKNANWIMGDIADQLENLGSFDGILSMTAMEFIPQPEQILHELYQKLKPGGCLVIGVIADLSSWSEAYRQAAMLHPESVFNQARFFTEEQIRNWNIGVVPDIKKVLFFSPDTASYEEALEIEKKKSGNPGFLVVRWQK